MGPACFSHFLTTIQTHKIQCFTVITAIINVFHYGLAQTTKFTFPCHFSLMALQNFIISLFSQFSLFSLFCLGPFLASFTFPHHYLLMAMQNSIIFITFTTFVALLSNLGTFVNFLTEFNPGHTVGYNWPYMCLDDWFARLYAWNQVQKLIELNIPQ